MPEYIVIMKKISTGEQVESSPMPESKVWEYVHKVETDDFIFDSMIAEGR